MTHHQLQSSFLIPDSNADGVDSFGYVSGASSEAVVSINIKPVNDPPRISFVSRNLNISSISEDLVIKLLGTDEDGLAPSPVVCALPIYGTLYQYDGKIISYQEHLFLCLLKRPSSLDSTIILPK